MNFRLLLLCCLAWAMTPRSALAAAGPVINEIFYHAPDDQDDLEWIEVFNPRETTADLAGWRVTKGVEYTFPPGAKLDAGGYLVLCRDAKLFKEFYEVPIFGEFRKSLRNSGDTLELVDASGQVVDRVKYDDGEGWPSSPDGQGTSLERITPGVSGEGPQNWAASTLPEEEIPAGSPGKVNDAFSANPPPNLTGVRWTPSVPGPGESVRVEAQVEDPDGIEAVDLLYQIIKPGSAPEDHTALLQSTDGRTYTVTLPPQDADRLVRIKVRARDKTKSERIFPGKNDMRPALTWYVSGVTNTATVAMARVIHTDPKEIQEVAKQLRRRSEVGNGRNPMGMSRERMMAGRMLEMGIQVPAAWFEWSVNHDLKPETRSALRTLMIEKEAEGRSLAETVLDADDAGAALRSLPEKITAFNTSLAEKMKAVIQAEKSKAFDKWSSEKLASHEPGPDDFLTQLMNIEDAWFQLSRKYEWTDAQWVAMRKILQEGVRLRSQQRPLLEKLMQGQGSFPDLLKGLGEVQKKVSADLKTLLTSRQFRTLQDIAGDRGSPIRPRSGPPKVLGPRGQTAFIWTEPGSARAEVFDFIHVTERSAGYKVRLHKDHTLKGMNTLNVLFEYNDRFVLAEPLAYEFYRRAGNPACLTDFARLTMDDHPMGYQMVMEQVNGSFLRRNRINPDGDLYKLLWYGSGIEGQHEMQDHSARGHADLVNLITQLDASQGDAQWEFIQKNFNVDEVATYFAVNMCLSHWDGFFNNYFAYHDRKGSGKWEMYPWDQDKTWGFHDSLPADKVFVDMPITFGMAGDRPPGGGDPVMDPRGWWRPPGFFSKSLLANPEFRRRFLARTRQLLETIYTPETFFPIIDAMAERIRPEVPIRAQAIGDSPDDAVERLKQNVASLKEHLVKRREFLLATDELQKLPRP